MTSQHLLDDGGDSNYPLKSMYGYCRKRWSVFGDLHFVTNDIFISDTYVARRIWYVFTCYTEFKRKLWLILLMWQEFTPNLDNVIVYSLYVVVYVSSHNHFILGAFTTRHFTSSMKLWFSLMIWIYLFTVVNATLRKNFFTFHRLWSRLKLLLNLKIIELNIKAWMSRFQPDFHHLFMAFKNIDRKIVNFSLENQRIVRYICIRSSIDLSTNRWFEHSRIKRLKLSLKTKNLKIIAQVSAFSHVWLPFYMR